MKICFSSFVLQLLVVGIISLQRQQGSFNTGVSWYEITLLEYPALRSELDLTITFPDENRPVLMILPWIDFIYDFRERQCFSDIIQVGLANHFRNTYLFLASKQFSGWNLLLFRWISYVQYQCDSIVSRTNKR